MNMVSYMMSCLKHASEDDYIELVTFDSHVVGDWLNRARDFINTLTSLAKK